MTIKGPAAFRFRPFLFVAILFAPVFANAEPIVGIGHIPIAVKNLEKASADFRALGFSLKPGHVHDNSVSNMHAKYPDGTELELITARKPLDAMAKGYLDMIADGDAPAYLALEAKDFDEVERRLKDAGILTKRSGGFLSPAESTLDYIFFVGDNRSPTDLPEHFAHANGTSALIGVWLADAENARLIHLFKALGATVTKRVVSAAVPQEGYHVALANGEILLVPKTRRELRERPIIGAVLATRDVDDVIEWLGRARLPVIDPEAAPGDAPMGRRVVLPPLRSHGLWIEFREQAQAPISH